MRLSFFKVKELTSFRRKVFFKGRQNLKRKDNKTSVGSVKLGKALDLGTDGVQAILEIFHPLGDRVKGGGGGPKLLRSSYHY